MYSAKIYKRHDLRVGLNHLQPVGNGFFTNLPYKRCSRKFARETGIENIQKLRISVAAASRPAAKACAGGLNRLSRTVQDETNRLIIIRSSAS